MCTFEARMTTANISCENRRIILKMPGVPAIITLYIFVMIFLGRICKGTLFKWCREKAEKRSFEKE